MTSPFDPVDIYCERTDPTFWSEPLNAITNASFLIAAWLLWRVYRSHGPQRDRQVEILILLIAVVGVGSLGFHTFGTQLAMLGDVLPIALFTFYYLWVALRRLVRLGTRRTGLALLGFVAVAASMARVPEALQFNGSVAYFPCLAALLLIGSYLHSRYHSAAEPLLKAALLFAVSLIFRSTDMALCDALPIGTHFLWHLLNGAVLYLLVKGILLKSISRS